MHIGAVGAELFIVHTAVVIIHLYQHSAYATFLHGTHQYTTHERIKPRRLYTLRTVNNFATTTYINIVTPTVPVFYG